MLWLKTFALLSAFTLPGALVAAACVPLNPNVTSDCDVVDEFLNNAFIQYQAASNQNSSVGLQALQNLKYYYVQDYYYLWALVINKGNLLTKAAFATEKTRIDSVNYTVAHMVKDINYANEFFGQMTNQLNITPDQINSGNPNQALSGYLSWLQTNTEYGQFLYDVSTIACIFGWAELANRVNQADPYLNRASPFYTLWITDNADYSYGKTLSDRLQANPALANDTAAFPTYLALFQQGLKYETALFNSALNQSLA